MQQDFILEVCQDNFVRDGSLLIKGEIKERKKGNYGNKYQGNAIKDGGTFSRNEPTGIVKITKDNFVLELFRVLQENLSFVQFLE